MNKALLLLALATATFALQAQAAGNPEAGKTKSTPCAACHGADGNSPTPMFPKLAGQNQDYLAHALTAYKSGKRKNPIMGAQAAALSKADIEDLAAYFAAQKGLTIKR